MNTAVAELSLHILEGNDDVRLTPAQARAAVQHPQWTSAELYEIALMTLGED